MSKTMQAYPEYKDSGLPWLGKVPKHWGAERLKWIAANIANQGPVDDPSMRYIALEHVEGWTGRVRAAHADMVNGIVKRFLPNDILFGKLRPYLAKVTRPNVAGCCVGEFFVLRQRDPRFIPRYYEHLLRSQPIIGLVNGSTFGAKMPRADWGFVGSVLVPIPPPDEQDAVARYLDEMDQRITRFIRNRERLIEVLNEQKQAIINRAVTRGLDPNATLKPSGIDWLGDIPEHWGIVPLCALAKPKSVINCQDRELLSVYLNLGVIRFSDVTDKRTNPTSNDLSKYQAVDPGDFVLNNQQAWRGSVGVSQHAGIVSPAYLVLSLNPAMNSRFANYLFRGNAMISQYLIASKGVGSIQRNLYWPYLKRSVVPVPPLGEQKAIAGYFDDAMRGANNGVDRAEREIHLIREYRTRLIADVVTGKVDVRHLAPPPGSDELEETIDELEPLDDTAGELDEEALAGEVEP